MARLYNNLLKKIAKNNPNLGIFLVLKNPLLDFYQSTPASFNWLTFSSIF